MSEKRTNWALRMVGFDRAGDTPHASFRFEIVRRAGTGVYHQGSLTIAIAAEEDGLDGMAARAHQEVAVILRDLALDAEDHGRIHKDIATGETDPE